MELELSKVETEALISLLTELRNHQSVAGCNDSFVPKHWTFDETLEYVLNCAIHSEEVYEDDFVDYIKKKLLEKVLNLRNICLGSMISNKPIISLLNLRNYYEN